MNDRETRRYDMFARVQTFGKDNAADFAAGSAVLELEKAGVASTAGVAAGNSGRWRQGE